jgi:hypothetical protein
MPNILKSFYFTFGRSPSFPFQDGYIIVKAMSREEAVDKFQSEYGDPNDSCVNCSFIYDENEWKNNNIQRHYEKPYVTL